MKVASYTDLRRNLAAYLDGVEDDRAPLLVTRSNGRHAVLISLDDFNAFQETAYLLSSEANAKRLRESIESLRNGEKPIEKSMDDLHRMAE